MGRSTEELRLPTVLTEVVLRLAHGARLEVGVFLPELPRPSPTRLAESLGALLNHAEQGFMPVRVSDTIEFIAKAQLAVVELASRGGPGPEIAEDDAMTLYDNMQAVRVDLVDGAVLAGTLLYSSPAGRQRVVDQINHPAPFFRLWTPDATRWINKAHVVRVSPTA